MTGKNSDGNPTPPTPPVVNENSGGGGGPEATPQGEENTIRIRLPMPVMNRDNIELWFIQLEAWFQVNGVASDKNKFSTVVAALDSSLLQQVYEVVSNPPATDRFKAIKEAAIKNFTESQQMRIQQFVSGIQLGDRKPTHLLNDLRRVSGANQDEQLLRGLWMQRLPIEVQTCLATVQAPLSELAGLANSVMDTFRVGNGNASASINAASSSHSTKADTVDELRKEVRELAKQMAKLVKLSKKGERQSRSQSRNGRSRTPARSQTPANTSTENNGEELCWYHQTFGDEADNCRDPCVRAPTKN